MKEEQSKTRERNVDGKSRGWWGGGEGGGMREFGKKGSIANVNGSFFSLEIDGVRWTGYPHPN